MKGDQDTLSARELQMLWARSHHLMRNSAVAVTAKKRLVANWIGEGIGVRWMNPNETPNKKMQKAWDVWIKECNLDGYGDFNNTQVGWANGIIESGETFTRFVVSDKLKGRIPLSLQMLEAEMLDPLYNDPFTNTWNGITFDEVDRPKEYNFWKRFPASNKLNLSRTVNAELRQKVSASDVVHIFERERPGQWRGIPILAPVILLILEMEELTDATLQRQKAAQAISWIITNTDPSNAFVPGMGRYVQVEDEEGTVKRKQIIQGTGGGVSYLNPMEDVKFSSIQDIGANLHVLLKEEWSKICSALGLAYHQVTGDLSDVNFSSIRAGLNELALRVTMMQENYFINLGMIPVCNKFQDLASIYITAQCAESYPIFDTPRRLGIDPLKDAQADLMEVQAGFTTLESKQQERGFTSEQVNASRDKAKKSGFVFTSVPDTVPAPIAGQSVADKTRPSTVTKETIKNPTSEGN
jgi:lambda family phage portal protein